MYISLYNEKFLNPNLTHNGILGLNPDADDETVRKRYLKLVLMLHPDKNKSVAGEEAFKFPSQVCSVLSDRAERAAMI
ncbi:Chaperone protein dnaJ 49 [Cardamine amara subsp. amara]|uniref:Chaperone protein dnaJ 49 n=1 Tax=Cardamine amara subsp. amara TaxID=228776 RepID=A0ABD0ZF58_CARAN